VRPHEVIKSKIQNVDNAKLGEVYNEAAMKLFKLFAKAVFFDYEDIPQRG
jgi:hypothetical protein